MSSTSSLTARQPAPGLVASVAVVAPSAVTEYDTASPPSAQTRPVATLVVPRFVVPVMMAAAPSLPVPSVLLVAQVVPLYPPMHAQVKVFTPSVQAPPLWQGFGTQSSTLTHAVVPVPVY